MHTKMIVCEDNEMRTKNGAKMNMDGDLIFHIFCFFTKYEKSIPIIFGSIFGYHYDCLLKA